MMLLLLKVTLVLTLPLVALPLMKRGAAAARHLVCALALVAALLLPITLLIPAVAPAFTISLAASAGRVVRSIPQSTAPPFAMIWAAGAAVLLLRLALGFRSMARIRNSAAQISSNTYEADVSVPVACGLLHPAILLPRGSDAWPASQFDAAIRHERAHIQRKDLWTGFMAHIACAVYWFHPLVWLVAADLRREQELACDDAVISAGFDPGSYAEALVAAARSATSTALLTGCPMLTPKTLKLRISRLLDSRVSRASSHATLIRTGIAAATVLIAVGALKPVIAQSVPFKVGPGVSAPSVLYKVDANYSEAARKAKVSGNVMLKVVVGVDGKAHDIEVVRGLDPELDANAISAVQQWRFKPGARQDGPVEVRATIQVSFRLVDDDEAATSNKTRN